MSDHYILDGHTPVAADFMDWARFYESGPDARRVAATDLDDNVHVSTVFLGVDHAWGQGPPILFETMVFRSGDGQDCWRYHTWDAAAAGHEQVVAALRDGKPLDFDPPMGGAA